MGFQWVWGVNNSIKLKELQVISGAVRKEDEGGFLKKILFQKVFLGEEGKMG